MLWLAQGSQQGNLEKQSTYRANVRTADYPEHPENNKLDKTVLVNMDCVMNNA